MATWKRRFAGSYFCVENPDIRIKSMEQYTTEIDVDDYGNRWVADVHGEDAADRFKTKREAIAYAEEYLLVQFPNEKKY